MKKNITTLRCKLHHHKHLLEQELLKRQVFHHSEAFINRPGLWLQQGFYTRMLCFMFEPLALSCLGLGVFLTFSPNPLIFFISSGTSLPRSQGKLGTGEEWDWQEQNHSFSTEHPHSPGEAVRARCLCSLQGIWGFSHSQDLTAASTWTKNPRVANCWSQPCEAASRGFG